MATLEEEIQDQRERHAVQMQKNLMEQERQKQGKTQNCKLSLIFQRKIQPPFSA